MKQYSFLICLLISVVSTYGQKQKIPNSSSKLTECIYDKAGHFNGGFAAVQKEGKWGFINLEGDLVIPCTYEEVKPFKEGIAAVKQEGLWYFINENGEYKTEGFEKVNYFDEAVKTRKNGKWGAYDFQLNQIVPHRYGYFQIFDQQFLRIERGSGSIHNRFQGVLSISGDTIIPLEYKRIQYNDGFFLVQNSERRCAYFDQHGEQLTKFILEPIDAKIFNDGYTSFCLLNSCRIVNKEFKVIKEGFYYLGKNLGKYFPVSLDNGNMGIYDASTKSWVIQPKYQDIILLNSNHVTCMKFDKYGILDLQNNEVVPFISDNTINEYDHVAILGTDNNLKGAYCFNTKYRFPISYEEIVNDETGNLLICKKGGVWKVFNAKGKMITSNFSVGAFPVISQNRLRIKNEEGKFGFIMFK